MNISLDGCCDHTQVIADEEFHDRMVDLFGRTVALVFGRNTYELLHSYWPNVAASGNATAAEIRLARILDEKPKYVVSSRDPAPGWNARRIEGNASNIGLRQNRDRTVGDRDGICRKRLIIKHRIVGKRTTGPENFQHLLVTVHRRDRGSYPPAQHDEESVAAIAFAENHGACPIAAFAQTRDYLSGLTRR